MNTGTVIFIPMITVECKVIRDLLYMCPYYSSTVITYTARVLQVQYHSMKYEYSITDDDLGDLSCTSTGTVGSEYCESQYTLLGIQVFK